MPGLDPRFLDVAPNVDTARALVARVEQATELDPALVAALAARPLPPELLAWSPAILRMHPGLAPVVGSLRLGGHASEREVIERLDLPRWTHARIDAPSDDLLRDTLAFLPASVRSIAIVARSVSLDAVLAVLARPTLEELAVEHHADDVATAIARSTRLPHLRRLELARSAETAGGARLLARDELADLAALSLQVRARGCPSSAPRSRVSARCACWRSTRARAPTAHPSSRSRPRSRRSSRSSHCRSSTITTARSAPHSRGTPRRCAHWRSTWSASTTSTCARRRSPRSSVWRCAIPRSAMVSSPR